MTGIDLKNAICNLDKKSLKNSSVNRKALILSTASVAAVITIVILAVTLFTKIGSEKFSGSENSKPAEYIALIKNWNDRTDWEKYTSLSYNGAVYSLREASENSFSVDEILGTTEISGFDENDTPKTATADLYSVKEVSADFVVAAKLSEGYGFFLNMDYVPETLGDLVSDLNFEKTFRLENASKVIIEPNVSYKTVVYDVDETAFIDFFKSSSQAVSFSMDFGTYPSRMSFSVFFGNNSAAFWLTKDGILCTNILDKGIAFNIGSAAADFISEIENNCSFEIFTLDLTKSQQEPESNAVKNN